MTESEAISRIKYRIDTASKAVGKGEDGKAFEDLELAIKSLEKQVPKKPKMRHIKSYDGFNDGWCPCCEEYIQENEYDMFYCQMCGQKLDWSDEE